MLLAAGVSGETLQIMYALTYNGVQLPPVLFLRAADHDLLEELAGILVRLHGALEVLRIVEQDSGVRLLQGTRQHRLLVFLSALACAGRSALVAVV